MAGGKRKRDVRIIDGVECQKCCRCWEYKTMEKFSVSNWKPHTVCKECKRIYDKEYRAKTKERRAEKNRKYRELNHDRLLEEGRNKYRENAQKAIERNGEYRRKKVAENWFAREWFHQKARLYIKKNDIKLPFCFICQKEWNVELHHPSYKSKDMWSLVVPLCRDCHRWVHSWRLECPNPINLITMF